MKTLIVAKFIFLTSIFAQFIFAGQSDTLKTSNGNLVIHLVGHGTLYFEYDNKIIHIDPYSKLADYSTMPKADLILITHTHPDHLDSIAIQKIVKDNTVLVYTEAGKKAYYYGGTAMVMNNGDKLEILNISIEAVPAYGIVSKRPDGNLFHPKGEGNGYIFTIGQKRIYVAGDTENIPEMKNLTNIDIAFLPMNQPYTMTPLQMADAALMFKPKILYPYHFGNTDVSQLTELLKSHNEIEIRLRDMK